MNHLPLAFLLGFLGSVHCAVMCGPLMLSMPLLRENRWHSIVQLLIYQLGRTAAYALLGFLVGLMGSSITFFASQETLAIILGSLLVFLTFLHFTRHRFRFFDQLQAKLVNTIAKLMQNAYHLPLWGFFVGFFNGLIPCAMVYLALATALNTGNVQSSMGFMVLFGLGTTPLMLTVALGGIYLKKYIRFNPKKLMPWFMLFLGVLFILRGTALGIPYFSPKHTIHQNQGIAECK